MIDFLYVIVAPMTIPEEKFGVVIVNSKLKETLPFAVKDTLEAALTAGTAMARFLDCEMVQAPNGAYKVGLVSWDPEGKQNGPQTVFE